MSVKVCSNLNALVFTTGGVMKNYAANFAALIP